MNKGFRRRLKEQMQYAGFECGTALLALLACVSPLRNHVDPPAYWVLAEVSSAILILLLLVGKEDFGGRLYATVVLGGLAFLGLWLMVVEGEWLLPLLFILYSFRAWRLTIRTNARPMDEVVRVMAAIMLAGMPALIAYAWMPQSIIPGTILSTLFFLCSAWFFLYPPMEWIQGYQPPGK
ncbi:MAG: hypothetical protein A2498_14370 [Lentisphaerae bacterium RIFOXYC12_FULL_60_16]|nr:MAG: hypothetical protein A2498_14370 [Lentisphaerae bacterium RIFOXYC12_FULL_60_16]OGV73633.1 MAG: hypothetical protein A2269_01825 [Lentisphaerae bacterium RIFOXYA12_FULL_60_10]OGV81525.1 MAG: hypothetical protein A2340_01020 [Lentisphaerae bacterium RIFOXYB12_FULL_60_10]